MHFNFNTLRNELLIKINLDLYFELHATKTWKLLQVVKHILRFIMVGDLIIMITAKSPFI